MRICTLAGLIGAVLAMSISVSAPAEVLDLDRVQQMALADNPSLMAAKARIEQAQARVGQAWSTYLPRLDASYSASKTWLADDVSGSFSQLPIPPNLLDDFTFDIEDTRKTYRGGISASWMLFDGFGRRFTNAVARFGAQESEMAYREAQRLMLDAVAVSYHSAQLAREQIEIAEADKSFNLRLLDEAKARRRVGTGSLSDELNFEVRTNAARTTLIQAGRAFEIAMIGLATLVGLPDAGFADGVVLEMLDQESPEDLDLPDADPLIDYAREHRPGLGQSRYALERAEASVWLKRSVFLPRVNATASRDATSQDSRLHKDEFSTTVGLSVSYNLFAGGYDRAAIAEAKAAVKEARRTLAAAEIQVASETRQSVERLRAAQDELRLQRKNADYVQRNRDLVEKGYAAGQESLVRLNEAQRDLVQARARLALARVSLRQAWHDLRTATAKTLESIDQ